MIDIGSNSYSPLTLAFLGDTVYDLLVRSDIISQANRPVKDLHALASSMVCASAQALAERVQSAEKPLLSEEESEVYKRGRNAHPGSTPKNQSGQDYHYATGLECLFGKLWLDGRHDRINELYNIIKESCDGNEKTG